MDTGKTEAGKTAAHIQVCLCNKLGVEVILATCLSCTVTSQQATGARQSRGTNDSEDKSVSL